MTKKYVRKHCKIYTKFHRVFYKIFNVHLNNGMGDSFIVTRMNPKTCGLIIVKIKILCITLLENSNSSLNLTQ